MAGHNKWSKVKHIKAREDAKKGKIFSRYSKEISIAARDGGGDPSLNPRLRTAIDGAKSVSMPKDNIERAIKKGTGELGGEAIEEITYEGFGAGGVAMIVQICTDNRNRSVADIRSLFKKANGNLGEAGSVAYLFERKGELRIPLDEVSEEELMEKAFDAGVDDLDRDEEDHILLTGPESLTAAAGSLREAGMNLKEQNLVYIPQNTILIDEPEAARKTLRLYEALDEYEDTMNVFANFDIPDEVLAQVTLD